jgi:hypothetical protein
MKKFLIILGIVIVGFFAVLVIVPIVFKGQVINLVKQEANKNINATLDFDDIGLSLIRHFPRMTLSVDQLRVLNKEPFSGDTLASLREFQATLNLKSLLFGKQVEINSVHLIDPAIHLRVLKNGSTNWMIMKTSAEESTSRTETKPSELNLAIDEYAISNGRITFQDEPNQMLVKIAGLQHNGKGDFAKTNFVLSTMTQIAGLTLESRGINYLNKAEASVKADIEVDTEQKKFTFKQNEVRLNELVLNFNGWLKSVGDTMEMDVTFGAPQVELKNILSMIPAVFQKNFADLKSEGQISLNGKVKGISSKSAIPAFDVALLVKNGILQYSQLPTAVSDIGIDLDIQNPGKTMDQTVVQLKKLHLKVLDESFESAAIIKTPISDPYLDASFNGKFNLGELPNIYPLETKLDLKGMVQSNLKFKGFLSAIKKGQTDRYAATGILNLSDIEYSAQDLPDKLLVPQVSLNFSPQKVILQNLTARIGKSDLKATGGLENVIGYVLENKTLKGTLNLQSNFFDLNPWMAGESQAIEAIKLPERVEFLMAANFKQVLFDKLSMTNMKGNLLLKNRILNLMDLESQMLQGSMIANGTYDYIPPQKPHIFFDLKLKSLNIPEMFQKFVTVQQLAPMAEYLNGMVSGDVNINTDLDKTLVPIWSNLFSQGSLDIPKVTVLNFPPLNKTADILKLSPLHNPALTNLDPNYQIKDGRFYLKPLTFKVDQYQILASGSNGLDKSLDYLLKIQIPATELKKQANTYVAGLIKQDVNLLTDETVVVDVNILGTIKDPKIQTSASDIIKGTSDQLKQAALKEAEKQKSEAEKQAQAELEKQKQELEKKKKEAEQKLKNKLKDLFNK